MTLVMDPDSGEWVREPAPFWTVAIYLCDRAYGGPEEGGWWFDTGERVDDPREYMANYSGGVMADLPRIFHDEDAAYNCASVVNALLDGNNGINATGNRDLGSVCCEGRYVAEVHRGYPPAIYPEGKPHYE